jgi:hypothetical protein
VNDLLITLATAPWHFFGVGVGQAQIIEFGLVAGTTTVVSYRLATRGKRYRRD